MTINDVINELDKLEPNTLDRATKIGWLSRLEHKLWHEIFSSHIPLDGDAVPEEFSGYTAETSPDTVLMVPSPYDEDLYVSYLQSQVDRHNGEVARYNSTAAFYNDAYRAFRDYWTRTHRPKPSHHFMF